MSVIGLLVVIAGLLVAVIVLLPDGTGPASAGETRTRRPESAEHSGDPLAGRPPVSETPPPSESDSIASGDETAAESDPDDRETWWLPAIGVSRPGDLVLVLDDAGNSLDGYQAFLDLPVPITFAVLPQLQSSVHATALAVGRGHEVILHQPLESLGGADPGPGVITAAMRASEIEAILAENLATVPGAVGVNNHMGSAGTADAVLMRSLLGSINGRGLFFLDSRTSAETVAAITAESLRMPFAERHVFLDNEADEEAILAALRSALERAATGESIVMIGHVTVPELADVLENAIPAMVDAGYVFAHLSAHVSASRVAQR